MCTSEHACNTQALYTAYIYTWARSKQIRESEQIINNKRALLHGKAAHYARTVERGIVYLYCYNISIEILEADINLNGYSRKKKNPRRLSTLYDVYSINNTFSSSDCVLSLQFITMTINNGYL